MAYPLEELDPMASDSEKESALQATIAQMLQEGIPQDQAQTQAMQMLNDMTAMPQWPTAEATNYGNSMRNPNSLFMRDRGTSPSRNSKGYRTEREQVLNNFAHGFNPDGRVSNK